MTFQLRQAKRLQVKQDWEQLFPELPRKIINLCVVAEKKEVEGKPKEAEDRLNQAIAEDPNSSSENW